MPEMRPGRRQIIAMLGAASAAACIGPGKRTVPVSAAERLSELAAFGVRRTGSQGAVSTAAWLERALRNAGYRVDRQAFNIDTLSNPWAEIQMGGERLAAFPQWRPPRLSAGMIDLQGLLSLPDECRPGDLMLRDGPAPFSAYWTDGLSQEVEAAGLKRAAAFLICVDTPSGSVFAYNRPLEAPDFAIPVVIFARRDFEKMKTAATARQSALVSVSATRALHSCSNVLARKSGDGPCLVISTPMTGWFDAVAERAPGILIARRLAEHYSDAPFPVTVVASSGHEIGHLGMKRFLDEEAPSPDRVHLWIHLGASLGAIAQDADFPLKSLHFRMATASIEDDTAAAFQPLNLLTLEPGQMQNGETGDILRAGYPHLLGLTGVAATFHTPDDRGAAVDLEQLARYEAMLTELVNRRFARL